MKLSDQTLEHWITLAKRIAEEIHVTQTRNDGSPYIAHPARVAAAVPDRLKPIAWLHDTLEDHPDKINIQALRDLGFPSYVVDAVDLLTHRNKEPNIQYWARIKKNPDALEVKLADINDNVNDHPSERARAKYVLALKFFSEP